MEITVIRKDGYPEKIFTGKPTEEMKKLTEDLNNNSLVDGTWTCEEEYTQKSMYDLIEFLEINK